MGRKRRFSSSKPISSRSSFVSATAAGFLISQSQLSQPQTSINSATPPSSQQCKLPDLDTIVLEPSSQLQKSVDRIYYLLLSPDLFPTSSVFIVIVASNEINLFQESTQVFKALNIPAVFLQNKTQSNTMSFHLKTIFHSQKERAHRIVFITQDLIQMIKKSKHLKPPFYVIPLINPSSLPSNNVGNEWIHLCNKVCRGEWWNDTYPLKLCCCVNGYPNKNHLSSSSSQMVQNIKVVPSAAVVVKQRMKAAVALVKANTATNFSATLAARRQKQLQLLLSAPNVHFKETVLNSNFEPPPSMTSSSPTSTSNMTGKNGKIDLEAKMALLNMFGSLKSLASKQSNEDRVAAATVWFDHKTCLHYGNIWESHVRYGASSDYISQHVRQLHIYTMTNINQCLNSLTNGALNTKLNKQKLNDEQLSFKMLEIYFRNKKRKDNRKLVLDSLHNESSIDCHTLKSNFAKMGPTFGWCPNPVAGVEEFGGIYGKPCGHNEVVMFVLRPFYPLEVLNTRLCSLTHPAPGNNGYHGCLEFLRLQCFRRHRAMTIWDIETFHFISEEGIHEEIPKNGILHWPLVKLRLYVKPLKLFTMDYGGQLPFMKLVRMIGYWVLIGARKGSLFRFQQRESLMSQNGKNIQRRAMRKSPNRVNENIVSYLIGGNLFVWRQVLLLLSPDEWIWSLDSA